MTDAATPDPITIRVLRATPPAPVSRILALKLDHLGDFLIGLPALRALRQSYPTAHITLVCGPWNRERAEQSGVADTVACYTFFPQSARTWNGAPVQPLAAFTAATKGTYDLAIDLRVDEDTRFLLQHINARLRCGIGTDGRQPFLDIVLPQEHTEREVPSEPASRIAELPPSSFKTVLRPTPSGLAGAFNPTNCVLAEATHSLPQGRFSINFDCGIQGRGFGFRQVSLAFEVQQQGRPPLRTRLTGRDCSRIAAGPIRIDVTSPEDATHFTFRIAAEGKPFFGRFLFRGLAIDERGPARQARLKRAELHIAEKLCLLVALVSLRTQTTTEALPPPPPDAPIVIAPYSNSSLRDWPESHYAALLRLLLEQTSRPIVLVGAPDQRDAIAALLAPLGPSPRLANRAGTLPWSDLPGLLREAGLVICNNSGIAHLAADLGAPLLALYSASHQVEEWGPRGTSATVLVADLPCAPCGHDRLAACTNGHACLRGLTPDFVMQQIRLRLPSPAESSDTPQSPA